MTIALCSLGTPTTSLRTASVAVLGTPYGEQRTPSHGDLFGILSTFNLNVRTILNKMNIRYRRQNTGDFDIYY